MAISSLSLAYIASSNSANFLDISAMFSENHGMIVLIPDDLNIKMAEAMIS
jgi:hypothetical protein